MHSMGMNKSINLPVLENALAKAGMNHSALAQRLSVSREAVSKWFNLESLPKPDKLLRIGMLVGLSYEQLVILPAPTAVPIVTFRRKARRKTKDVHLDGARETGELLKRLVPYLPDQELTQPPTLKAPIADYEYTQRVAGDVRREMALEGKAVIQFEDLIDKFTQIHAVIVPVLWGAKERHENALYIHLPDSKTTWVFLNLDSNAVDFKFWMAHELGHSLAPTLADEAGEKFAESFAQALLFPESHAVRLRAALQGITSVGARIECVRKEAEKHIISPYTIRRALEEYEQSKNLPKTNLGELSPFMGFVNNFGKNYETITQLLFGKMPPEPKQYIALAQSKFGSPIFSALKEFCKHEQGAEHFIHRVFGVSLADAKALLMELRN